MPSGYDLPAITHFLFSDTTGKSVTTRLAMGGFGISRFVLDEHLYNKVVDIGGNVRTGVQVESVVFDVRENQFRLELAGGEFLTADYVIGAFGKRSKLDKALKRSFIKKGVPISA